MLALVAAGLADDCAVAKVDKAARTKAADATLKMVFINLNISDEPSREK